MDQAGFGLDQYRRSPLAIVIGERRNLPRPDRKSAFHNSATLATRSDTGFDDTALRECREIFRLFALYVQKQIARRIAIHVLDTYLGTAAGRRVLSGAIQRDVGEPILAIIWMSNLRGHSNLTDRLPGPDVLVVLNEYFERLASAIIGKGGQILKFIGDGLLAVFPVTDSGSHQLRGFPGGSPVRGPGSGDRVTVTFPTASSGRRQKS